MKITKHISFYYIQERLCYINRIIDETNSYKYETDIFIHTNSSELTVDTLNKYTNGTISIIYHDLSHQNPYYLTWKCRDLLKTQRNDYDIFMYIEDDILVPYKTIEYWLEYHTKLENINYNLGFMRIEIKDDTHHLTDLENEKFSILFNLYDKEYCINNINPYCAFWIYDKIMFNRFVDSNYYNIQNISGYDIRESSAIGLHGISNFWYKGTAIPVMNNKLHENCKIYHMPNNYVFNNKVKCGKMKFDECIKSRTECKIVTP